MKATQNVILLYIYILVITKRHGLFEIGCGWVYAKNANSNERSKTAKKSNFISVFVFCYCSNIFSIKFSVSLKLLGEESPGYDERVYAIMRGPNERVSEDTMLYIFP